MMQDYNKLWGSVLLITAIILIVEFSVNPLLISFNPGHPFIISLIRTLLLVLIIVPLFYFLVFRPLISNIRKRELAEACLDAGVQHNRSLNEKLRISEENFRSTLDNMLEGAEIMDFNWRCIYINDSAVKHSRYSREELLDHSYFDLYPGIENYPFYQYAKRCLEERTFEKFEFEYTFPGGETRWFDVRLDPVPEGVFILSVDITEQRRAKKMVEESEQRWITTLSSIADAVIATDEDGKIIFLNHQAEKLLSCSLEDAFNHQVQEFFTIRNRLGSEIHFLTHIMETGMISPFVNETLWIKETQQEIPVAGSAAPIRSREGIISGVVITIRDISFRIKAEERMAQLSAIVTNTRESIISVDLKGIIQSWNEGAEIIYGYSAEESIGRNIAMLVPEENENEVNMINSRIVTGEIIKNFETWRQSKDGRKFPVAVTISPIRDEAGNLTGSSMISHDVTEHKKAEEALRESEERYRTLLYEMNESFCLIEMISDENGQFNDYRFLDYNKEFEKQTGFYNIKGKLRSSLDQGGYEEWIKHFINIIKTGNPQHFEQKVKSTGKYYDVRAYRHGGSESLKVSVIFSDITERRKTDKLIRKSEVQHRSFFESGLIGIIYWNTGGKIIDANDKFLLMTGYTRDDLVTGNIDWIGMTPPEYRHLDEASLIELKASGYNQKPFEKEYVRKDGSRLPVLVAGAMLNEERTEGVAYVQDISESKNAEIQLRQSEERFSKAFYNGPFAASIVRLSDNKNIEVNATFLQLFEFRREEVIGVTSKELNIFYRYESRSEILNLLERSGTVHNHETLMRAKSGRIMVMLISVEKIIMAGEQHIFVNYVDITGRKEAEEAVRQSEERFSTAFRSNPSPACITRDSDNIITDVNDAFLKLLEYSREEVVNHSSRELNLFREYKDRESAKLILDREGKLSGHELEMQTRTGKKVTVLISVEFITVQGEKHFLSNFVDITGRKEREMMLGQYFSIIRHSEEAIVSKDLNGIIQTWNKGAEKIYGYTAEEIIGKNISILLPPGEVNQEPDLINRVITEEKIENFETNRVHKNGTRIPVSINLSPIRDQDGKIYGISIISHDITERKKAEEALRESERRWVTTLSSLSEGVIATDIQGNIIFMNPEAECLTGWVKQEVLYHPVNEVYKIIDERTRRELINPVELGSTGENPVHLSDHTLLIRKEGEEIPIENSRSPIINDEGETTGVVLVFHDITERKKAQKKLENYNLDLEREVAERTAELEFAKEKAESADKLKTSFLLTMSHELRTPLNSIIGFSGILQQEFAGPLNEEQKKQMQIIQNSGRNLLRLVNEILDLSKIEMGELTVHHEEFNLMETIREIIDLEEAAADEKGLTIYTENHAKPIIVESDPFRIHQVLLNIVHNAIKFTEKGSVSIMVSEDHGSARVRITDTGIGISEENIGRLFNSFVQIDNDLIRRHRGTGSGLGLAISKKLMEMLDGNIEVESKYGEGSTFTISFPLKKGRV